MCKIRNSKRNMHCGSDREISRFALLPVCVFMVQLYSSTALAEPISKEEASASQSKTALTGAQEASTSNTSEAPDSSFLRPPIPQGSPSDAQEGSVESFFQVRQWRSPAYQSGAQNSQKLEQLQSNKPSQTGPKVDRKKPLLGGTGRLLWHIMDNAGIPMFGYKGSALAPELEGERSMIESKYPGGFSVASPGKEVSADAAKINSRERLKKIPELELEGVELPVPGDRRETTP